MLKTAPLLPYSRLVPVAADHDALPLADVKSEEKEVVERPTSDGQVFLVGSQSVEAGRLVSIYDGDDGRTFPTYFEPERQEARPQIRRLPMRSACC